MAESIERSAISSDDVSTIGDIVEFPEDARSGVIKKRLEQWTSDLLDMTLRNALLNHKDTSKKTLPAAGEEIQAYYDHVVAGQPLRIHASEEYANASPSQRIDISLTQTELDRRCLEIYRYNVNEKQETGSTTLFAAFGYLQWYEANSSATERFAPLILVPVTMNRVRVGGPYEIVGSDEAQINVTLVEKLRQDFGVELDNIDVPDDGDAVEAWLMSVQRAVQEQNFNVLPKMAIAVYKFGKIEMWADLQKHADALLKNPLVQAIVAGSSEGLPSFEIADPEHMDDVPTLEDLSVLDVDSSQRAAIHSVLRGGSVVLQGPPGTGKSQTITNLIAQALGHGKTVLFVSQKRAALDVVHTRLQKVGLGPFTLNAYANNASKKDIVRQLEEPLTFDWPASDGQWSVVAEKISRQRNTLNEHKTLFHTPGTFGETAYQMIGKLVALDHAPRVRMEFSPSYDRSQYDLEKEHVENFARHTQAIDTPKDHPYRYVQKQDWSMIWSQDVASEVASANGIRKELQRLHTTLQTQLHPSSEPSQQTTKYLAQAAKVLIQSPVVPAKLLNENRDLVDHKIENATRLLTDLQRLSDRVEPTFALALLDEKELSAQRDRFGKWASGFFLFAFFALFFARRFLKKFSQHALPDNPTIATTLEHAVGAQDLRKKLHAEREVMESLFGVHWQGENSEPEKLERIWQSVRTLRVILADLRTEDAALADRIAQLASDSDAREPQTAIGNTLKQIDGYRTRWEHQKSELQRWMDLSSEWSALSDDAQWNLVEQWDEYPAKLRAWCDWLSSANRVRDDGYDPLVDRAYEGALAAEDVVPAWHRALREATWETWCARLPELASFRGLNQEQVIEQFRQTDEDARDLARQEIQARIAAQLPSRQDPGEMDILRREFEKKRAHKPLRKLMSEAGNAIARLKPCMLMSPLAVARYLEAGDQNFDLVVFDEASQILPADGIGAIARGKQVVVVGDSKQLPPTRFFQKINKDEEDVERMDLESILDESVSAGLPELTLNWHYRSQHESLIAFSNKAYYHNRLHLFPSPHYNSPHLGLKWHYVRDGVYDRGGAKTNRREAEEITQMIVERLRNSELQGQSIGVVTFSQAQQDLISDLLDRAQNDYPEIKHFMRATSTEPLFVRNLENVQGDERDVIFLSVGYGPDAVGKFTLNFGPLNGSGGERRLNVAITRARMQCVIVSSFSYDRISATVENRAVLDLRNFLEYAARGKQALLEQTQVTDALQFDSPFEEQVYEALTKAGWTVHSQVGVSGFFIDLAVVHPERPGLYILAVECDGASYHSAKTARDRDRIRQNILENLGWNFHRIWSTDWWQERRISIDKLLQAVEIARQNADKELLEAEEETASFGDRVLSNTPSTHVTASETHVYDLDDEIEETLPNRILHIDDAPRPWPENAWAWTELPAIAEGDKTFFYENEATPYLREQIAQLLEAAAPLQIDTLTRHVATAWGFQGLGGRIRQRVEDLLRSLNAKICADNAVWLSESQYHEWNGFRYHDAADARDLADVPFKELYFAMRWSLECAFTIDRKDLLRATAKIFGAKSLTKKVQRILQPVLDDLLANEEHASIDDESVRWRV